MDVNYRVRKYRTKLLEQDRNRLEVWIGGALIQKVREVASNNTIPVWSAVETALEDYVMEYQALVAEGQRLTVQRDNLLDVVHRPDCAAHINEYNRQLAAYNERLSRFQRHAVHITAS